MANKDDFTWLKIGDDTIGTYTWIIYCDDEQGTELATDIKTTSKYIGFKFNNKKPQEQGGAEALDVNNYTMIKIVGDDGKDATENYTWIRYSDDRQGHRLSKRFKHQPYVAFGFNKKTKKASTNPKEYQFVRTGELDLHKVSLLNLSLKDLTNLGRARFRRNSTFKQVSFDSSKVIKNLQMNDPCLDNRTGFLLIHGSYKNVFKDTDLSDFRGFRKSKSTIVDPAIKDNYGFILENSGDNLSEKKVTYRPSYSSAKDKPLSICFNFDILGKGEGLPKQLQLDDGSTVDVEFKYYGIKLAEVKRIGRGIMSNINSRHENVIKAQRFDVSYIRTSQEIKDKGVLFTSGDPNLGYPAFDELSIVYKSLNQFPLEFLLEMPCYFEITDGDKKGQIISDEGCGSGVRTTDAKNKIVIKGMTVTNTYIPMPFTSHTDQVKPAYLYIPLRDILIPSVKERLSISFDLISPYVTGSDEKDKSDYTIMYLTTAQDNTGDLSKSPLILGRDGADLVLKTNLGTVTLKNVNAKPHRISVVYSLNLIRLTIDNDKFDYLHPTTFVHTDPEEVKKLNEKYNRTYADSVLYEDIASQNVMFNSRTEKGEYHEAWYGLSNIAIELIGDR